MIVRILGGGLLLGCLLWASHGAAQAPFFADGFDYADGDLTSVSSGTWTNHNGSVGTLDVQQQRVDVLPTVSEDAHRDTGSTLATGATWYYAVKFKVADRRMGGMEAITPVYFMHFMEANAPPGRAMYRGRLYIQGTAADPTKFSLAVSSGTVDFSSGLNDTDFDDDRDADGNDFLLWQQNLGLGMGAANNQGDANNDKKVDAEDLILWKAAYGSIPPTNGQRVPWATDLSFDTEYTAVVSYTADDDDTNALLTNDGFARLWVDPTNAASPSVLDNLPHANITMDATRPQQWLAIRQGGFGTKQPSVSIGAVAVGSDFDAVLAGTAALSQSAVLAVPEPNSGALALMALAGFARRRVRRAQGDNQRQPSFA